MQMHLICMGYVSIPGYVYPWNWAAMTSMNAITDAFIIVSILY
jgi:hypothetical protein